MKRLLLYFSVSLFLFGCSSTPSHPLYGKWKLAQVADSIVVNNPDEVTLEFFEDGKIISTGGPEKAYGTYLISDDTTQISILEAGKVIDELKILQLTKDELLIAEGKDFVRFIKVED